MSLPAWSEACEREAQRVVQASLSEELGERGDLTSTLVMRCRGERSGTMRAAVVAREAGVLAGVRTSAIVAAAVGATWEPMLQDGSALAPGSVVGILHGPSVGVLAGERTLLNLLGVLCGTPTRSAAEPPRRQPCCQRQPPWLWRAQDRPRALGSRQRHRS